MQENITFNVKELASYIGIGESTTRSLIYQKKIPFYKIGSKYFFRKQAIDNWILSMENQNRKG